MDRQIIWPGAIPLETDILSSERNAMLGLGGIASALFGATTSANGMTVAPTSPASLAVVVGPGEIYAVENVDNTAYSSLAADTQHQTVKQGISNTALTIACAAPTTAGQSINYLIEATFAEADTGNTVLPYYNASNPAQAYSGPANSGTAQPTVRKGEVVITAKPGVAATTGTQATPAADAGYIGLAVVTVAYGATAIAAGNITLLSGGGMVPAGGMLSALLNAVSYVTRLQTAAVAQAYADHTTPGTYTLTVPTWATRAEVYIVGAGGGGGGSATGYSGAGGGAGGFAFGVVNVAAGATLTAIVGAGGAGSTGSSVASTGGTSSLSGIGSATGGAGGVGNATAPAGGASGSASGTGLRNFSGGEGGDGSPSNANAPGGNGAPGPFGGGGRSGSNGGLSGAAPGAGGGGAWNGSGVGGSGASGAVLVRWLP